MPFSAGRGERHSFGLISYSTIVPKGPMIALELRTPGERAGFRSLNLVSEVPVRFVESHRPQRLS